MGIDFDEMLNSNFVKLETGKSKKLVVRNWRPQEKFTDDKTGKAKPGLVFDVPSEDDQEVEKTWTVTSIRALLKLRPIIEQAEADSIQDVTITVVRIGEGKQTAYDIKPA